MPRPEIPYLLQKAQRSSILRRGLILAVAFVFWMALIIARLYYLQVIDYIHWLARAQRQQQRTIELSPQRGAIYDRRMHPLAMSLPVDSIYAAPSQLRDPARAARLLSPVVGLAARDLEERFAVSRSFCWIKRKASAQESARVRALDLSGIYFQKEMKRFYPMGDLAAGVLGYVGMDDRGLAGLEQSLNSEIRGQPGHALLMEDARRQTFGSKDDPGEPGMNVVLTLDAGIQYIAERVLDANVAKWHAAGGVVVVQNPDTGAILAMASDPTFDPNHYAASSPEDRIDRGVAWIYEPGSTFKPVTISSAIQEDVARPADPVDCQMGAIVLAGRTIHDDAGAIKYERSGDLTVSQILAHSSDVGTIKLALKLGENRFYNDICNFGFGSKTGLGLPAEERGLLMPPDRWSGVSIGEIAIGQGISVTPLQLADAYSAIANGGFLIQPRIVQELFRGSNHQSLPPSWKRRVLSPGAAATMRQMLLGVIRHGTGEAAQLDGYSAGGKTGTAQKVENGHYSHTCYVASFAGLAPASHPALTILVAIDTPHGAIYGAEVAAPAWKEIAQESLSYLNVPHDAPLTSHLLVASETEPVPMRRRLILPLDTLTSLLQPDTPDSRANRALFAAPHTGAGHRTVVINAGPTVLVPDFAGLGERRVADMCQALGLELNLAGTGLAVQQSVQAGSKIPEGSRIEVYFAR